MGPDRPPPTLMAAREMSCDSMMIYGPSIRQPRPYGRNQGTMQPSFHRERARIAASSPSVRAIGLARMLLAFLAASTRTGISESVMP